ncbi:hypothetical protein RclHR1_05540006 [Rhizophagus clarus]|nr:hypothetical protein RclHR1_05540006 [Rhizophagus clarus]
MKYIYFITLLILASAALGSAQLDGLSSTCQNTLTQFLGDKNINNCFPFSAITPLATTTTIPDQNTLKTAADAICAKPKCSDNLVSTTLNQFKTSCQTDISNNQTLAQLVNVALSLYSPMRDSICYKNSTGGYCFIESEAAAEQILQSAPKGQNPAFTFAGAQKNQVCTPCNKAIFNTFFNYQNVNPSAFSDVQNATGKNINDVKGAIEGKCGQNFIDGKVGDSTEDPQKFQTESANQKSSAASLVANPVNFVVLVGSLLAML